MTDSPSTEKITTPEAFESALEELLAEAITNGVEPRGSWVFRRPDNSVTDLEIIVYELD